MNPIRQGLALCAALLPLAAIARAQPVVICPRTARPPILDGNVTEDEWAAAGRFSPFLLLHNQGLPSEPTDVRVMYDNTALYIAAVLHDAHVDQLRALVTETDGDIYTDDCFEVFLDALGTGKSYVHMVVNSRGTMFDEQNHDRLENFQWNPAVMVKEGGWSVEIAVPFGAGAAPTPGTVWRFGTARNAAHLGELSSWNAFLSGFHEPGRFGTLEFGGPPVSCSLVDMGARKVGRNSAALSVRNAGAQPLELKANVRVSARDKAGYFYGAARFTAPAVSQISVDLPYEVKEEGEGSVLVSVSDPKGVVLYRTAAFPIHAPEVVAALVGVESALADANRAWSQLPDSPAKQDLRPTLDQFVAEWGSLADLAAKRNSLTLQQQTELEAALRALRDRIDRAGLRLRAAAASGPPRSFVVTPVSSLWKVHPDDLSFPALPAAHLDCCRNEWQSLQLVVQPITERSLDLTANNSDLKSPGGMISAGEVDIRPIGFVPAVNPLAPSEGKRLWPDILGPPLAIKRGTVDDRVESGSVKAPPAGTQPLWVSVHVPTNTPPGEYAGEIKLTNGNEAPVVVQLSVTVHRTVLPDPAKFHFCLDVWQAPESIAAQYGVERWSARHWQLLRPYLQDLAAHGQRLATVGRAMFDWRRDEQGKPAFHYEVFDRYVALCREVGIDGGIEYLGMFNPGGGTVLTWANADGSAQSATANPGEKTFDDAWSAFLADWAKHLADKGWLKNVFLCPADEPRDQPDLPALARFARCAELVHAASPEFKTTAALDSLDSAQKLAPVLDRMVFKLRDDVYSRDLAAKKRAEGGRVEAYVCCHPDRPNTFITSPNLDTRVIPWLLFRENLGGLLRWSYTNWPSDPRGKPEGDGTLPPGDLFLVYPGPEGPFPSPRWEILRDGIEDYECLTLLRDAITQAHTAGRKAEADRALAVLESSIRTVAGDGPALTTFTDDPAALTAARAQVLAALDALTPGGG